MSIKGDMGTERKMAAVDTLCRVGIRTFKMAEAATKAGLARFTGDQHNESWEWNRAALLTAAESDLIALLKLARAPD